MIPEVLQSSENPQRVSLTLQGATVLAILYVAHQFGFYISDNNALEFVEAITILISAMATVYGIYRKIRNVKQS